MGLGALVGWLCSYYGLDVGASPTEVPQKASRAVVQTLLACIVYNAMITVGFYWLVGGRIA
jgi:ABC-type transporter Mla maintaining outer membrane lipid asymmetry permease subunit MlaE